MIDPEPCHTLWLSAKILETLRGPGAAPFADTAMLENFRRFADEAGGRGMHMVAVVVADGAEPRAFDLGTGSPVRPRPADPAYFGFGGLPPREGRFLLLTIAGEGPWEAALRVETIEDGARHGFLPGCPAVAATDGRGFSAGYYCHGVDVCELGAAEIASVRELGDVCTSGRASSLAVDPRHVAALAAIVAAEDRGEGVVISAASVPGLNIVRAPGTTAYRLADDAGLAKAMARWNADGAAVLSVRNADEGGLRRCSATRRVGGLLDGAGEAHPGAVRSAFNGLDGPVSVVLALFRRGRRLDAPEHELDAGVRRRLP